MKIFFIAVFLVIALIVGEWIYRGFLRSVEQPTPQMLALANHLNEQGIKGHIYPVRHGFRHTEVSAAAAFQIEGFPLPIAIEQCPNEAAAEAHLVSLKASPNLMHPQRNGLIVVNLPMWGDDTTEMATKVSNAFTSFKK
ncbi:hypothetical protein INP77_06815 [Methylophilus sp. 13]|uniref:hypothetical protein n=1 Tax=Methylophilus sp. 13 TaxID=2781018 RepID=UPI00188DF636|nr:hypothetical protein [Methylophilus sp. 13]MBF5039199.1 hypothetical protein [Methylophilus sp. 13]